MTEPTPSRNSIWLRWLGVVCGTVVAAVIVRRQVASPAEVFWCLFPIWLLVGSRLLRLFPCPQLAQTRLSRWTIIAILIAFPIGFYLFMVRLTQSVWSWTELAVCIYFFSFALESFLLVFFAGSTAVANWLKSRMPPRWSPVAVVVTKLVTYAILIPFLLVTFAVHRPKLIAGPLEGIAPQTVEYVDFPSRDGLRLHGLFLSHPKPEGTVIVCHGVGANHADIQHLYVKLNAAGFQILAFDFRGHGSSAGHTVTYGWQEQRDVLGAYDYCLSRHDVRKETLFALGVSMGGAALLQSLPEMPLVRAAVVDSAFASLELMADHQLRFFPGFVRGPMVQLARGFAWIQIGADLRGLSPADRLREIPIPLLIIHGSADTVVPVDHAARLQAAAAGPVSLYVEPGAPHIGSVVLDPTGYVQRVKEHFLKGRTQNAEFKMQN